MGSPSRVPRSLHRAAADIRRTARWRPEDALPRFLAANVTGGICWAGGTTALVYFAGMAAQHWLERFSWIALVIAVIAGITAAILLRERTSRAIAELEAEHCRKAGTTAA